MNELENKKYKSVGRVIFFGNMMFLMLIMYPNILYLYDSGMSLPIKYLMIILIFMYLSASFAFTRWHIWAFKNTRKEDWIELEQRAFEQGIITKKNYWFRTKHQKKIIKELNNELEMLRNEKNLPYPQVKKNWLNDNFSFSKPFDILFLTIVLLSTSLILYFLI